MTNRNIVVVGASAGGVQALKTCVAQLPADFAAAVFIVWHVAPDHRSFLPEILQRHTELPVAQAIDGESIRNGRVYVSRPDHHLLLEKNCVRVVRGPKENRFRPSVDALFRSAAASFGRRVIGVVLTGFLDDGAAGLFAIKQQNGVAVVQDPLEAEYPDMPLNAMRAVTVDHTVSINDIGELLTDLASENIGAREEAMVSDKMRTEVAFARGDKTFENDWLELGEKSALTCPDCRGSLIEIRDAEALTRFRCHTGHAFSLGSLLREINKDAENSLWTALSKLEEGEMLLRRIVEQLNAADQPDAARFAAQQLDAATQKAALIKRILTAEQFVVEENFDPK